MKIADVVGYARVDTNTCKGRPMTETSRRREQQSGRFEIDLAFDDAFKLFTAEGERLWVPGWSPEILGPLPQAPGLVFMTGEESERTIWTVLESRPDKGVLRYSRVTPGSRAGLVEVRLEPTGDRTRVQVTYDLTALSPDGERDLEAYSAPRFAEMLENWQALIAEFLTADGARDRIAGALV